MKSLTLFNNKGGVGKTTMTFNLAHMFARLGRSVAILDCDPQCNLSALALSDEDLEDAFQADVDDGRTVAACVEQVRLGKGDLHEPDILQLEDNLYVLPGDLSLSRFESKLAKEWPAIFSTDADSSLHVVTAIERLATEVGNDYGIDVILFDVGPSLGALNRAVLLACDAVVIPLAPDLFSLRGLQNVGEAMIDWRRDWASARIRILQERDRSSGRRGHRTSAPPEHAMRPIGYVIQQHLARDGAPLKAYAGWVDAIPDTYAEFVLDQRPGSVGLPSDEDPNCLGHLRHFASLVPLAQAAGKPIFDLKHADGVLGSQFQLVERARVEFTALAQKILARLDAA